MRVEPNLSNNFNGGDSMIPKKIDAISVLVGGAVSGTTDGSDVIYHDGQTPPTEKAVQAKLKELQAEHDSKAYARARAVAYPSWQDQMDLLYHGGVDALKAELKKTKDKYPKPT